MLVREESDWHELSHQLTRLLHDEFEIEHTQLLSIEPSEQGERSVRSAS